MNTNNETVPSLDLIESVIASTKTKSNNQTVNSLHKEIKRTLKKEINDRIKSNDNVDQLRNIYDILCMFK